MQKEPVNDDPATVAFQRLSVAAADLALAAGMRPLARSGWEKVLAGLTTLDELVRNVAAAD